MKLSAGRVLTTWQNRLASSKDATCHELEGHFQVPIFHFLGLPEELIKVWY